MKNSIKIFSLGILAAMFACEDPELPKPVPATEASKYYAKFLFINATPDAPSLDLYINNNMVGTSVAAGVAQEEYDSVGVTSNAVIANTNIRTKATSGTIGGVLGSNDLIYRAGNNNANNFTAGSGLSYTVIAVDSINRPAPVRTLNASNFGDITYYSPRASFTAPKKVGVGDTTISLTVGSNNSVTTINLIRKYNGNAIPSFLVPIGIVPLGSSDVGGIRYYVLQDVFPAFGTFTDSTTKAGFRVVNAAPGSPGLFVRLKFVSGTGTDIKLPVVGSNPVSFSFVNVMNNVTGGLQPSVGSRTVTSTTATFQTQTIAPAGTPNVYNVEVATDTDFTQIIATATLSGVSFGGSTNKASNYTILVSGVFGGTGSKALKIAVVEHN